MSEAIVVGAGIGGATAAVALEQRGWQVTMLERAQELGEVGAGISVWPGAVAVLEGLGVTDVRKTSVEPGPAGLRQPNGHWLVDAGNIGVETPVMIHRAQLHDLITARFGTGITVRTGVTVTAVAQHESGVTVTSTDGEEFRADLVIAADGIHSAVRPALYPDQPGPRYSGYTAYRGVSAVEIADGGGETWGTGLRFGHVPLVDGRIYWYATANQPRDKQAGPGGAHGDVTILFGDWHDPIPAILAATPKEAVLHNDILDLPLPLAPFVSGRVVLLGDAAHAMTPNLGQGACSAIEDAGALSRHLHEAPDLATALSRYDAERRPATAKLIKRSRLMGSFGQVENRLVRGLRDGLLGLAGRVAGFAARRRRVEQSRR
jgi:2-polyprenyl-6-methoxyphenol hydroxylase-like FAD-dependent oxidoreductase